MTKTIRSLALCASLVSLIALTAAEANAQKRGGGAGRSSQVRSSASGSVNRAGKGNQVASNRVSTGDIKSGNRTNINTGNINTGDVNINRDVDIDVDGGYGCCGYNNHWGAYATGVVVGATVTTATAWRMGAYYSTLPTSCVVVYRSSATYYQCGTYWYRPVYSGMNVQYVAIVAP